MLTVAHIRTQLSQILHLHESPQRTALAFAVGVFIAFSPTYGLHTLSILFCAWAFRLNLIALMGGAFICNPWTVVPILGATVWTGFQFMDIPQVAAVHWEEFSLRAFYDQIMPFAGPFFLGGFILSVVGALVSYPAAYLFIFLYRARRVGTVVQRRLPDEP